MEMVINMQIITLNPINYPLEKGESWYVVHPNQQNVEFRVPEGAVTLCTSSLLDFQTGRTYEIYHNDPNNGWLSVMSKERMVKMPYYVFARYFDAECFVRGTFSVEGKKVEPFDYKPTTQRRAKQLELFEDSD